jgi:drug/metabolite transporter (DMT)-like permease
MQHNWKSSPGLAMAALIGMTAIWGWTFLVVKDAIGKMPVMDFLAVRFSVAAIVLFAVRPKSLRKLGWKGWWHGAVIGFMLGMSYITQTFGLRTVSPGVSGFITGMGVIFTPFVMWLLLRRKIEGRIWIAVALSLAGLAFLSLHGWAFGRGELLTVACAVFVAFQVIGLGEWSGQHDAYGLATVQIITSTVMMLIAAAPGGIMMPPDMATWGTVVVTAILATALAFVVQTWAQSLISPSHIAVILTMEPVFAGIFSVAAGRDRLTLRIIAGAVCILAAMLIAQVKWRARTRCDS